MKITKSFLLFFIFPILFFSCGSTDSTNKEMVFIEGTDPQDCYEKWQLEWFGKSMVDFDAVFGEGHYYSSIGCYEYQTILKTPHPDKKGSYAYYDINMYVENGILQKFKLGDRYDEPKSKRKY